MLFILPQYIIWHYSRALLDFLGIWMNFLWFIYHFFSLPILVSTLFSPWKRLSDPHQGGANPVNILESLFINIIMRFIGFFIRMVVIALGLLVLLLTLALGVFFFIVWLLLPIIMVALLIKGVGYLF